jgi:hypothetical protein
LSFSDIILIPTTVPLPNIYLPLLNYDETILSISDINKKPIINLLDDGDFNTENGVSFDGSNDKYIMTSDLSGNYTICFNIFVTNIVPNTYIFNQGQTSNNGLGLFIQIKNSNTLRLGISDTVSGVGTGVEASVSLLNTWNFICITVSSIGGGWIKSSLWINGIEYIKAQDNKAWASGKFILGGQLNNGSSFTGRIRNFMTFTSKLSFNEINAINSAISNRTKLNYMLAYNYIPIKYNITIPSSIINKVITFKTNTPMINPSNSTDNYTNYVNIMNPIELKDNILTINGVIVNLFNSSIFNKKQKIVISFNNSLYAVCNNTYTTRYDTTRSYPNIFNLSIDQNNNLSTTIQYTNIVFSNPTIKLYNTLTDIDVITFSINSFTITPIYTTPSQFKIQDNTNSWNNNLVSLNLSIPYTNNILTCQLGNTIQLRNFTSTQPLILSYNNNNIIINKFNSSGNGLFTLDPTTIATTPSSSYQSNNFTLTNVKLSSPDINIPLMFSNILITPTTVPLPNIYLQLLNYEVTLSAVDISNKPVIISELTDENFDFENGVLFDGSNNKYIMTSDLPGNYTICFSIYVTNIVENTYIFNHGQPSNNGLGLCIQIKNTNTLKLTVYDSILNTVSDIERPVTLLNTWNFICITVSSISNGYKNISLWINGTEHNKGSNRSWTSGRFILGGLLNNRNSFTGYIRHFMTFSSTLSSSEINTIRSGSQNQSLLEYMLAYTQPVVFSISPSTNKYNLRIPSSIINKVLTFDTDTPMINPSDDTDDYTNYINMMNPIELKDNKLIIKGVIVNLFNLHIFNNKQKVIISFSNSSNSPNMYALYDNTFTGNYTLSTNSKRNTFNLSRDQINELPSTVQYANFTLSNPTIKLCNTLTDTNAITFSIKPFTIKSTYTTPSQFIISDNTNPWNNILQSLNLLIRLNNNILSCQQGNTIQLTNFTSTQPLTLSYKNIVINKFNSSGNGLFTIDPTSISTVPIFRYKVPRFTLTNVKLSSPAMTTPLLFSDIPLIPTYV